MTIHKAQGQTLSKVVVDLGNNEISMGLSYVALSRVKNIKDMLIEPFCFDRLDKLKHNPMLTKRKLEDNRLLTLILNTNELINNL